MRLKRNPRSAAGAARWIVCAIGAFTATASVGSSLSFCQSPTESNAAVQDRMMQVAAIVKGELERSGRTLALVSRSGLALQRLGQRYSHTGVSLKASANAAWSVRQLYYACDEQRPRIFDQGMTGFVLGSHDPAQGFLSIVFLPDTAALMLERTALDDQQALQLLGGSYSANAYAFGLRYQNCNQWLAELLARSWTNRSTDGNVRAQAQQWLQAQGYEPSLVQVHWQPLVWLAANLPWLHTDDHPSEDLAKAQFRVSLPESIESFVHSLHPDAQRIELCYNEFHVVIRRSWLRIEADCHPGEGDEVTALSTSDFPTLR